MSLPTHVATLFSQVRETFVGIGDSIVEPGAFANAPQIQRLLDELVPTRSTDPDPAAAAEYLTFLWALYRYWARDGQSVAVPADRLGELLAADRAVPPISGDISRYVQLPDRAFWARVSDSAPHEPIHGLFVIEDAGRMLTVLAVLGVHRSRGGFSQVAVTVHPSEAQTAFGALEQVPFAPAMAGGDRAGFHSVSSTAELLVLAQVALAAASR